MACIRYLRFSVFRMLTLVVEAPEELGGDDVGVPRPLELGEGAAHDPLGLATRVGLGVVEEVHPGLAGSGDAVRRERRVQLGPEGDPRTERQHAHLEPGAAEPPVLHFLRHGRAPQV